MLNNTNKLGISILLIIPILTQADECQLYAVNDKGLNNSQFFTISPITLEVNALGDTKKAHDI